jgi:hypothetical protein
LIVGRKVTLTLTLMTALMGGLFFGVRSEDPLLCKGGVFFSVRSEAIPETHDSDGVALVPFTQGPTIVGTGNGTPEVPELPSAWGYSNR